MSRRIKRQKKFQRFIRQFDVTKVPLKIEYLLRPMPATFYGIALAAFGAECLVVYLLFYAYDFWAALGLHVVTLITVALSARAARDNSDDNRFGSFLLPALVALGPFGASICLLAAVTHSFLAPDIKSPAEWIEKLFEHTQDRESDRLLERITLGLDDFKATENVLPFRDVLSGGTTLQKQAVITKIARYFRPQFAPLLLQAAHNNNAAVRGQAATVLVKIERDFMSRYIRLENSLKDLPDGDPEKLRLAELYDEYAYASLLDDSNRQILRQKAIRIYEACLAQHDEPQWRICLARLYLREDQPEPARHLLQDLAEKAEAPSSALYWYMEALFRLKQFAALRKLANDHGALLNKMNNGGAFDEVGGLLYLWQTATASADGDEVSYAS
jgi:hypothetical protein